MNGLIMRKLTWLKLWANPEKGGTGIYFFALASSNHWDGVYKDINDPSTRSWSTPCDEKSKEYREVSREYINAPLWDVEIIDQSIVPTELQILLLTAAAESNV